MTDVETLAKEFRTNADRWFDLACAHTDAGAYLAAAEATARSETWRSAAEMLEAKV